MEACLTEQHYSVMNDFFFVNLLIMVFKKKIKERVKDGPEKR